MVKHGRHIANTGITATITALVAVVTTLTQATEACTQLFELLSGS